MLSINTKSLYTYFVTNPFLSWFLHSYDRDDTVKNLLFSIPGCDSVTAFSRSLLTFLRLQGFRSFLVLDIQNYLLTYQSYFFFLFSCLILIVPGPNSFLLLSPRYMVLSLHYVRSPIDTNKRKQKVPPLPVSTKPKLVWLKLNGYL